MPSFNRRSSSGFTVIELVLALVILCILSALIALTASGVQAKNRNTDRQTEIDTIRRQLEGYYAKTDTYPTLANLNDVKWRSPNLPDLKIETLQDPRWNKNNGTCRNNDQVAFASEPAANCYSYQVTTSDGSPCDNNGAACAHYTLTATLEGGEKYVKSSLN